jgi:hypothetical protein
VPAKRSDRAAQLLLGLIPGRVRVSAYMDGDTLDGHGLVGAQPAVPKRLDARRILRARPQARPAVGEIAADLVRHGKTSLRIAPSQWSRPIRG